MTACVECGNDRAVSMATTGMICRDCQDRRNEELGEAATLGPVWQQVDPDATPLPCGETTCDRDATEICRLWSGGEEQWVLACEGHSGEMAAVVADLLGGES